MIRTLTIREAKCCLHCKHAKDESFHGGGGTHEEIYCKILLDGGLPKKSYKGDDAQVNSTDVCDKFEI